MLVKINKFFFDERDIFVFIFGLILVLSWLFKFPLQPFRLSSLTVLFIYLLLTRSVVRYRSFGGYLLIALFGLLIAMALSPYALMVYLFLASFLTGKFRKY